MVSTSDASYITYSKLAGVLSHRNCHIHVELRCVPESGFIPRKSQKERLFIVPLEILILPCVYVF